MYVVSVFNHKGGVSKTTSTFHLGWKLAQHGHTVLLVDADPQCNLTGLVMDFGGPDKFDEFYEENDGISIRAGLAPAFESRPEPIKAVDPIEVELIEGLYLMPGDLRLSEYDTTLSIAQNLSGSIQALKNIPGSISHLLRKTGEKIGADVVLVDMNPSLSAMNQNLLMISDYFLIPTSPDYFSIMALNSISHILPQWSRWYSQALTLPALADAVYKLPNSKPKLLGTIIQNFRPRDGRPASAFQTWITAIQKSVSGTLVPALAAEGMMPKKKGYSPEVIKQGYTLGFIPNFNSLIAFSQKSRKPIFALTQEDVGQAGTVWATTKKSIENFDEIYEGLATEVAQIIDAD